MSEMRPAAVVFDVGNVLFQWNLRFLFAKLIADLHRHKISIFGCFVFGLDEDTPDVFAATAKFVARLL